MSGSSLAGPGGITTTELMRAYYFQAGGNSDHAKLMEVLPSEFWG